MGPGVLSPKGSDAEVPGQLPEPESQTGCCGRPTTVFAMSLALRLTEC